MPKQVLVVDDEPELATLLCLFLSAPKVAPHAVYSAEDGLAWCRNEKPDLIFLDLYLKGKSSLECLKDFQALAPQARIVLMSGADGSEVRETCASSAHLFLQKPFGLDEVQATIRQVFGSENGQARSTSA